MFFSFLAAYVIFMTIYRFWDCLPKKTFTSSEKTNILITGASRGLGRLLAAKFARNFKNGEVNIILLNRTEKEFVELRKEMAESAGGSFPNLYLYRCDVSDANDLERVWK